MNIFKHIEPIENEVWDVHPKTRFYVSTHGRIVTPEMRLMKGRVTPKGVRYDYQYGGRRTSKYVQRFIGETYVANPKNLPRIKHKDGNIFVNLPDNLVWCSHKESLGKNHAKNSIKYSVKIPPTLVVGVYELYHDHGKNYDQILEVLGLGGIQVSKRIVQDIVHGRTWSLYTQK